MDAADASARETLLLLIRHGQTEWNREGRVQGHTDSPLTDLGRAQADALARALEDGWLPGERPAALVSSDLGRARATAAPMAAALGLEPELIPDLREMNFGALEGATRPEIPPEVADRLFGAKADPDFPAPGGESRRQMLERARRALTDVAGRYGGRTVVAVSHGGVIGFYLRAVLGLSMSERPRFQTANGSVAAFRLGAARVRMMAWGLVPPLTPSSGGDSVGPR